MKHRRTRYETQQNTEDNDGTDHKAQVGTLQGEQAQSELISAYMYVLGNELIAFEENEANCKIGVILYWYTLNKDGEREYIAQTSAFFRNPEDRYSDYSFSNKVEGR